MSQDKGDKNGSGPSPERASSPPEGVDNEAADLHQQSQERPKDNSVDDTNEALTGNNNSEESDNSGHDTRNQHDSDSGSDEDEDESSQDEQDEDEEDDSGDEEEEEEPVLKYERPSGLLKTLFTGDVVSTTLIDESAAVFAMHSGAVHVLDPRTLAEKLSYRAHSASVLDVSIAEGGYVGSASMDGTVAIISLTDEKDRVKADFKRPVHSIALDPNYKTSKSFVSGGMSGNVVLSERNWWGNRVDTILYEGEDVIMSLRWFGSVLIWMNQKVCALQGFSTNRTSRLT